MRQSIGPAISVRLRGVAGWSSSAMSATAASAATQGWQIAIRCAPGPIARGSRSGARCTRRGRSGPRCERHVARVVPVGDVDVVVGAASCARCRAAASRSGPTSARRSAPAAAGDRGIVLAEMQQRAERRACARLPRCTGDLASPSITTVDAEGRPRGGSARPARTPRRRRRACARAGSRGARAASAEQRAAAALGQRAQRPHQVGVGLIGVIEHACSGWRRCRQLRASRSRAQLARQRMRPLARRLAPPWRIAQPRAATA